jgi:hypothetical protein
LKLPVPADAREPRRFSGRCANGIAGLNFAIHAGVNFPQLARTSYSGGRSGTRINNNHFFPTAMETSRDGDGTMQVKGLACLVAQSATIIFAALANHALKNRD